MCISNSAICTTPPSSSRPARICKPEQKTAWLSFYNFIYLSYSSAKLPRLYSREQLFGALILFRNLSYIQTSGPGGLPGTLVAFLELWLVCWNSRIVHKISTSLDSGFVTRQGCFLVLLVAMMLLASLPTLELAQPHELVWSPSLPSGSHIDSLLSFNKASDRVAKRSPLLREVSPLLRANLAAYFARHTQPKTPHTRTHKAHFATAHDAQNLNSTAIEAVYNDGRRSLLEAKLQETTARQCSASYVEGSHVESAKIADLCKWRDT